MKKLLILISVLIFAYSCNEPQSNSGNLAFDGGLILPDGFKATIFADNLGPGRHITVKENGDVYVSLRRLQEGKGAVALRDTSGNGKADLVSYFAPLEGTGIELHNGFLYYGSDTAVVRFPFAEYDDLIPSQEFEVIAGGLLDENQHAAKPFEFDGAGNMYVTIGAPSNACMEQMRTKGSPGMDPCPLLEYSGGIWKFKEDVAGQTQANDGVRFATGIRHAVALKWNDKVNRLYAVQHGRDQLNQFFPDMYDSEANAELPAEEFLLVDEGSDFGWPYCYYDQIQGKKVLAPEYGGDGIETGRCEAKTDPILGFPGHIAPNDLVFYHHDKFPEKYIDGAFIAFHGSWNRAPEPQEGFNVAFVPFEGALPSGDWEVFADGFSEQDKVKNPNDAKYRPCGLDVGPDGALYVVDSREGRVWKIVYENE